MRHQAQVGIRLEAAYLCECGMIVDSGDECMCGNTAGLLKLSPVLNRQTQEMPVPVTLGRAGTADDFLYDYE